jgi:oxygen-dependent protoporphyrinogen oxidase
VFEASANAGGRVRTVERDDYLIDTGASALASTYRAYLELATDVGLAEEIVPVSPTVAVFRNGALHELNMKHLLWSGIRSGLLSSNAKIKLLRIVWDIVVARLCGHLDYADMSAAVSLDTESAAAYARRVLTPEIADYIASPVVRTMLIADSEKVSKVELFSGIANIFSSRILALRGGQQRLPLLLAGHVRPRYCHEVLRAMQLAEGVNVCWRSPSGQQIDELFDGCIVSCPLPDAVKICPDRSALLRPLHQALQYTQCITVAVAVRRAPRTAAFLVQMPSCEDPDIALMFLDHNKSRDRAPPGSGLINCHWDSNAAAQMFFRPDEEIVTRSLNTIQKVFPELRTHVQFTHVTRWQQALPFTTVGAYRRISEFNASLDKRSPIQFAGDYMSAAGQNSAIVQGTQAAGRLLDIHGLF